MSKNYIAFEIFYQVTSNMFCIRNRYPCVNKNFYSSFQVSNCTLAPDEIIVAFLTNLTILTQTKLIYNKLNSTNIIICSNAYQKPSLNPYLLKKNYCLEKIKPNNHLRLALIYFW